MSAARASTTSTAASKTPSPPIDEQLAELSLTAKNPKRPKPSDGSSQAVADVFAILSERERPRLCPLRQPYAANLHDRIEELDTTAAVRAALHLLNDDFIAVHENCHVGLRRDHDRASPLVFAIVHRREKLYLEAEEMWKSLEHPLVQRLYNDQGGPLKFQRAVEGVDGKRVSEAKRAPLEEIQFAELKALARWAIDHAGKDKPSSA